METHDDNVGIAVGDARDVWGFLDLSSRERVEVDANALVFGPAKTIGMTLAVLRTPVVCNPAWLAIGPCGEWHRTRTTWLAPMSARHSGSEPDEARAENAQAIGKLVAFEKFDRDFCGECFYDRDQETLAIPAFALGGRVEASKRGSSRCVESARTSGLDCPHCAPSRCAPGAWVHALRRQAARETGQC